MNVFTTGLAHGQDCTFSEENKLSTMIRSANLITETHAYAISQQDGLLDIDNICIQQELFRTPFAVILNNISKHIACFGALSVMISDNFGKNCGNIAHGM